MSQWIYYLLCEGANLRQIQHETKGSAGQINISLTQCRQFKFPVPSIEEQKEIIVRVEAIFSLADLLEARIKGARQDVDLLTPAILAKAFRGELVPQDPHDEPVSFLLERIRELHQAESGNSMPSRCRRNKNQDHPKLSPHVPTIDPSKLFLEGPGGERSSGGSAPRNNSEATPPDYSKGSSPMPKDLIQVLEEHQSWIPATMACQELGISDGSTSDDMESFYRQLKEKVDAGLIDVMRRGEEDWLKLIVSKED
jgi:type I restriction enzyme S subunit